MKRNVLNRVDVQDFYHERFFNFSMDIFGAVPVRDFTGRDFTEKSYAPWVKARQEQLEQSVRLAWSA